MHVEHEISLACAVQENRLVSGLTGVKECMVKQFSTYDQPVGARFAKLEAELYGLRVAHTGAYQMQRDFEQRYEKKQATVEQSILGCLFPLQETSKVYSVKSVTVLEEMRKELTRLQQETLEKARTGEVFIPWSMFGKETWKGCTQPPWSSPWHPHWGGVQVAKPGMGRGQSQPGGAPAPWLLPCPPVPCRWPLPHGRPSP